MVTRQRKFVAKTCNFWNCEVRVKASHDYCPEHYRGLQDGKIDVCKGCGRAKDAKYPACMDCRNSPKIAATPRAQPSKYREEHSDAWAAGDANVNEFYVCILKLSDGSFYAGQTREIRERLMEHRDGTTKSTVGKNPKLVWVNTVSTRKQATELEVTVKNICDSNPREIRRWVRKFHDLVEELDFS